MTTNFKNQDFINSLSPGITTIKSLTLQRNVAIGGIVVVAAIAAYYGYQHWKRDN